MEREILKEGLHRELQTKIVYTVTDVPYDLESCSFVVRENITKDHYIYYEEVTRDMPGFQTWPHHKPMNIEAPVSTSEDQDFIWRLPFSANSPNSYITNFWSHIYPAEGKQTNTVIVKYRFHYRYQMVQSDSDYIEVTFGTPKVFIDCRKAALHHFRTGTEAPIINQINKSNKPNKISQMIPVGRIEHRDGCILMTLGLTILGSLSSVFFMYTKT